MAKVLFATHSLGMVILPLMLFHQIQLMICAVIAQRYARRDEGRKCPCRHPERRLRFPYCAWRGIFLPVRRAKPWIGTPDRGRNTSGHSVR
jgi:hypothetical protein